MRHELGLPVYAPAIGGRGVLLDRRMLGSLDQRSLCEHLPDAKFVDYLNRWLVAGESYFGYYVTERGTHHPFESTRPDLVVEWLEELIRFSEARDVCAVFDVHLSDIGNSLFASKLEAHWAAMAERSKSQQNGERFTHLDSDRPSLFKEAYRSGESAFVLRIPAAPVQKMDVSAVLAYFDDMTCNFKALAESWMSLCLRFDGWEVEPQNFHRIEQARCFVQALADATPWWLGLVHESDRPKWFASLLPASIVSEGNLNFERAELAKLVGIATLKANHYLEYTDWADQDCKVALARDLEISAARLWI